MCQSQTCRKPAGETLSTVWHDAHMMLRLKFNVFDGTLGVQTPEAQSEFVDVVDVLPRVEERAQTPESKAKLSHSKTKAGNQKCGKACTCWNHEAAA